MNIALVKRRYSLKSGGSERYCVTLCRQLKALGHSVTVIGESIDKDLEAEVSWIPVRVNNATSWTRNRSFAERCGRVARDGQFEVVYGIGRSFGLDAVRITERLQAHWVQVYYRGGWARTLQRLNPRHRTLIDLERAIYRSDSVHRIVTQSSLDRRLVMEYYGVPEDRIRTIYNGVDTGVFNLGVREHAADVRAEFGIEAGEPLCVFAAMDFDGKGLASIFQALGEMQHRDVRLLVLGAGPVRRFTRIARTLGVERRVIFAGRRQDVHRCYGAGNLFLLPTTYEPFPNVNLEAMACGLPVMTTRTAGGADIIREGQNGYLISRPDAVDEMARCIDEYFGLSLSQQETMSNQCWDTAQMLTVERNALETLDMFHEVMRDKFRV